MNSHDRNVTAQALSIYSLQKKGGGNGVLTLSLEDNVLHINSFSSEQTSYLYIQDFSSN